MNPCPRTPPIVPSKIPYRLDPNTPLLTPAEAEARFRAHPASAETIENWTSDGYGNVPPRDHFRWADHWRRIPYNTLLQVFSFDEVVRFWFEECIMSTYYTTMSPNIRFVKAHYFKEPIVTVRLRERQETDPPSVYWGWLPTGPGSTSTSGPRTSRWRCASPTGPRPRLTGVVGARST